MSSVTSRDQEEIARATVPDGDASPVVLAALLQEAGLERFGDIRQIAAAPLEFIRALAQLEDRRSIGTISSLVSRTLLDQTGAGLDLAEADLAGLDLSGLDLRGAKMSRANLASTRLQGTDLAESTMVCPLMERTTLTGANLRSFYAHALSIVSSDASEADLSGAIDCTGSLFHGVAFVHSDLRRANFAGCTFYQCDLTDADLSGSALCGATFNECILRRARLVNTRVEDATITRSQADGLVLDGAMGEGLTIQAMTGFRGASLRSACLAGLRLRRTPVIECDFTTAQLANLDCLNCALVESRFQSSQLTGARLVKASGERNDFTASDLSEAKFLECTLPKVVFDGARAENAEFLRCVMHGASFGGRVGSDGVPSVFFGRGFAVRDSDLSQASFAGAYLYRAFFTGDPVNGMILDGADFTRANLIQAYIAASMREARLTGAYGAYSRLNQTDLTDSSMSGMNLYQSSLVKTKLAGARLTGVLPPLFMERCTGIDTAVMEPQLQEWCRQSRSVNVRGRRGST